MKEAAAQGRTLMQRLVVRASDAMLQRAAQTADDIDRQLLGEAARRLMKHEQALCEAYPQTLLSEFAQAIAGDTRKAASGLSFDSLELMGDEQMRENVDLLRMQQTVKSQVEAELTELNALISSVQGLKSVQPDRNPLRPEMYVRSVRAVVMQSPIPSPMRSRWMLHVGEALGPELARVYTQLSGWMRSQGVSEARFVAVPAPDNAPPQPTLLNLRELRNLVTGELVDGGVRDDAAHPDFGKTMPAALDALENMKQVDAVVKRMKARQVASDKPLEPAQVLAQEVVNLMVENIASDERLLAPVQQCVRDLEPALMRLARDDPRFFSDRKHPARRLLDELTTRSLAWESVSSPGFKAFIEPLKQAIDVLRTTHVSGGEPFDFALKTLEDAWGDLQQRDRHHREKAVRALLNAEQRNLLAEKLSKGLRDRPDLEGAPPEIVAFVTGPWSQVIAQARLTDTTGSHDPGGFTGVLTDLIWSVQPRVVGTQTTRLLKMVPTLVEKVRHGLAMIDYPQASMQRFLDYLSHAHRMALRGAGEKASQPPQLTREELDAMMGQGDNAPGAWLAPGEAQDSGFMGDTQASLAPRQVFVHTEPRTSYESTKPPETDADLPELPVDQLLPGAWVVMKTGAGWARFQVTWASPHGTLFMLTGAGGKPQSLTRRLLS